MATKKKRFQYQARIGTDAEGKPIRKAFYSYISTEDAHRLADEWIKQQTEQCLDVCNWAEQWLEVYKKSTVSTNTYRTSYKAPYDVYIKPYFTGKRLDEIKPIDLQQFYNSVDTLRFNYLKKIKNIITGVFNSAYDNGHISNNPVKSTLIINSKTPAHEKGFYTDKQIEAIEEAFMFRKPIIVFLLETGLRLGELCGLKWEDLKGDYFNVNRALIVDKETGEVKEVPPKKKSYRSVPLTIKAKEVLANAPHVSEYVFAHKDGSPLRPNSESINIRRFLKLYSADNPGTPDLTAHELRHSFATKLRRHGVDVYTIQKILGHKKVDVTADVYVHNEVDVLINAIKNNIDC